MISPEQIAAAKAVYDGALTAQQAAKAIIDSLKASSADTVITYERAKAAFDALKPSQALAAAKLKRAEADVTIARAEWQAIAPKEAAAENAGKKGTVNKELLTHVTAFLATKTDGATNQEIFDALLSAGVEMAGEKARENLNSYLSRWASAGSLVSNGAGKYGVVPPSFLVAPIETTQSFTPMPSLITPSEPVTPTPVPAFAAPIPPVEPVVAPSFLAPVEPTTPVEPAVVSDVLGDDFPGAEALAEAGLNTRESLTGKTAADLVAIPGIGAKTADKILAALAA